MPVLDLKKAVRLHRAGRLAAAEKLCRQILLRVPDHSQALNLLGVLTHATGQYQEAWEQLSQAVRLQPAVAEFHANLGAVLMKLERLGEAETTLREALRLKPDHAEAHKHLGDIFLKRGRYADAIEQLRRAVELKPEYSEAQVGLATAFTQAGRIKEAIESHRHVVELQPKSAQAHSNLLFMLHYDADVPPQQLFEEHVAWGRKFAEPLYPAVGAGSLCSAVGRGDVGQGDPAPTGLARRIRLGYVSCDFRAHPVARFIEPALEHHDRSQFEVFLYSAVAEPDGVTERIKGYGHVWRDISSVSDDRAAEMIREDHIDILVDLMGHIGGHRLLIFARRPAPVQITYLGYPDTTGMRTMDYRITDSWHDPKVEESPHPNPLPQGEGTDSFPLSEGESQGEGWCNELHPTDAYCTEKLIRLDPCAWCWRPDEDGVEVNELPALSAGHVTFGCLNKLVKVTPEMLGLWARILEAVPGSRLKLMVSKYDPGDPMLWELLESWMGGVLKHTLQHTLRERVIVVERQSRRQYLKEYHGIDIALDTFPYNGHTTTCDALWMGVPVVSLAGQTHVSRAGLSVMSNVGLGELATDSPGAYVERAVALAGDLRGLAELRGGVLKHTLRARMGRSALRDEGGFTGRLEGVYRASRLKVQRPAFAPLPMMSYNEGLIADSIISPEE
jgi:predicted O-linked N-acetylglucosamine transferase (SPINDLY family)